MGRGGKRVYRRDYKEKRADDWKQDSRAEGSEVKAVQAQQEGYLLCDNMENVRFEEYYKAQGNVPEGEWGEFMGVLRKPLPVTFRINGGGRFASALRDKMQSDFFSHLGDEPILVDGEAMSPPRPLPWYPNKLAWHMSFSRAQLRKIPLLGKVFEYIKHANEHGSISRQEAVSMVPPLFMDVQSHHKILDMCAAPGSKTQQLLEALHTGGPWGKGGGVAPGVAPTGFVIANDADFKRCSLLTHQLKRICSPCLMVTNHSAEQFPSLGHGAERLKFDRILCDVPCSGDGTMRKSPDIWQRWTPNNGNALHNIQLRIAMQGGRLLAVGGLMVYSTCTFNPVEDEAVVSELLLRCGGALELMDVSDQLPELRRMPGMTHWRVADVPKQGGSGMRWYADWEEAMATHNSRVEQSMFPSEAKAALPLHRCMRFLPHHQDTGGFFVAVLRKVKDLPPAPQRAPMPAAQAAAAQAPVAEAAGSGEAAAPAAAATSATPAVAAEVDESIAAARSAAASALEAAARCVSALESGERGAAITAGRQAEAAAQSAQAATHFSAAKRLPWSASAAAAPSSPTAAGTSAQDAAVDEAAQADENVVAVDEEMAQAGGPSGAPSVAMLDDEDAQRMEVEEGVKEGAGGAEAVGGDAVPAKYSWIRGGGGRGRAAPTDPKARFHLGVDPVVPVEDAQVLASIATFYGLPATLPLRNQLITRSLENARPKRMSYVSRSLLDLLMMDTHEQLKIAATGLKVLERQEDRDGSGCSYRLAMEGLPFLLPHVTRQRVTLPAAVMLQFLTERTLDLRPAPQPAADGAAGATGAPADEQAPPEAAAAAAVVLDVPGPAGAAAAGAAAASRVLRNQLQDDGAAAALGALRVGCCIVELGEAEATALGLAAAPGGESGEDGAGGGALAAGAPMALVAWRGRSSVSIMVDKECAGHYSRVLTTALAAAAEGKASGL